MEIPPLEKKMSDGYRMEVIDNCYLIFGPVPMRDFAKITKFAPKNAVMSMDLSYIANCNMAFGLSKDVDLLVEKLKPVAIARVENSYKGSGVSNEAIEWLAVGNVGRSSKALFFHLTGAPKRGGIEVDETATPSDPEDLIRCLRMLEAVPEAKTNLSRMSEMPGLWSKFHEHWEELVSLLEADCPQWMTEKRFKTPLTYERMSQITRPTNKPAF